MISKCRKARISSWNTARGGALAGVAALFGWPAPLPLKPFDEPMA